VDRVADELTVRSVAFGWLLQYAAGGIAPPLIMIVINGAAQMLVLTPLNT
jgi:hypothetical protein